jgi:CO/xanthine dehydrogenase Mo-binding subunit/CO/xanthine dehydrogenase FAD-binding subunit
MSVGERIRPLDWAARSLGTLRFTADLPGQHLHGAVLRSPHPYAEIVTLDIGPALRMRGVHAVITAEDFPPGITYLHRGAPLSDRSPLAAGVVRHVGQEVAAVAADTPELARAACAAIRVRYRVRRAPLTVAEARRPGVLRLHDRTTAEPNVSMLLDVAWGDVAAGLAASTVSVSGSFVYPSLSHAVMEPNTTLASWVDGRVELWTSTQAPWFIQKEVSHLLGIPHDDVVIREVAVGGGFGSKSKISEHEVLAAALSRKAGRSVLLQQSREEEFASNKPRHRFETTLVTHADAHGVIRALEADVVVDNGSHNHMGTSVMRVGVITLGSMYRPDGVRFSARLVDTATQPGGQFRGYGTPQVSLAMESQIDELAERLGLDPLELRLRNLAEENTTSLCGYEVGTNRLGDCLLAVRDAVDWTALKTDRTPGRGVGVAAGSHGSGAYAYELANRSDAAIDLFDDGRVRVRFGGADAGTGQSTILAQVAAEELGVPVDRVEVLSMDSDRTPFDLGAWSSRGTHMTGFSVGQAARELAAEVLALGAMKLGTTEVRLRDGAVESDQGSVELGDLVRLSPDTRDGVWSHESSYLLESTEPLSPTKSTANLSPSYAFAAHAAVVDVDRRTGEVSLVDYVAAHDVGRAINPTMVEGQIVGGAVMGLGGALGEETIRQDGRVVNSSYLHYAMPRSADVPSVRPIIVGGLEPAGPYGAKAVGEMSIIPPGAAVANAVYDAVGVRIRSLPITPDKVLTALAEKEGRRRRLHLWRRPGTWWVTAVRALYPLGLHTAMHRYGTRLGRGVGPGGVPEEPQVLLPTGLDEAIAAVADGGVPVGGASDVVVERRRQPRAAPVLVALTGVGQLRGLRRDGDGDLHVGAAVTLAELAGAARELGVPALAAAVDSIASPQIRNTATVAGNLAQEKRCWFFRNGFSCYKRNGVTSPCYAVEGDHRFQHAAIGAHRCQAVTPSDLGTVLLGLDATVVVAHGSRRRLVPMGDFYTGPGETCLKDGELITEIVVPAAAMERTSRFEKLALYTGDFATASAFLSVARDSTGTWTDVRVVLGAMAPTPLRLERTERALTGRAPSVGDVRAAVDRELDRIAHPLPGNGWKLDAAAGLVERAADRMLDAG